MTERLNRIGWIEGLAALAIVVATAAILLTMGRTPICECGTIKLWHGVVVSSENSQHLSDWYSPSHLIHGFLFFFAGWLVLRRASFGTRLILALVVECAWEIAENTDAVIQRYREATIALDYYGDSVLNSVADIGFMVLGFWLASRLPVWLTVTIAVGLEIFVGWMIRDNLTLNVLMLLWPLDAVKAWQGGA
ncbi:DUF2585 domain-containing protein [Aurantimonas coralicida]|uniref:DUF2585 domain-containing protein n=1 Tax=Aurantimonas coralicida TaxID=182270 RepID=UPI00239B9E31|nr:DUF2585 domain-containing protein [Aurantimonas coralicida]MDE0922254.1 DUF2585 domain-containing protein [Aurantimonas coralicida]